jgi:hypothetical protein
MVLLLITTGSLVNTVGLKIFIIIGVPITRIHNSERKIISEIGTFGNKSLFFRGTEY